MVAMTIHSGSVARTPTLASARSNPRFATACGPVSRAGRSDSAMKPPIGCTDSREESTSGNVAVTRTSTPSRRTTFATWPISSTSRSLAATKTHSAPVSRMISRRSPMLPTTEWPFCEGSRCAVETNPIGS